MNINNKILLKEKHNNSILRLVLNDPKRNYKGNEPSPKGYGYCARYEPEGSQQYGYDGNLWEVDEFEENLAGLIIAEIELDNISQSITIPEWVGIELTGLKNWSNASLSKTLLNAIELKNSLRPE